MNYPEELKYQIALSLIPLVGSITAKNLIAYLGSVEAVFDASEKTLTKIPGIGKGIADNIVKSDVLSRAGEEMEFMERNRVDAFFYLNDDYPARLKSCVDAPLVLFSKGTVNFNNEKVVAIVGTRNATDYGRKMCEELVAEMAKRGAYCVVSGLAYGIDVAAHKACLKHGVPTIGVLGHGLDCVYPSLHRSTAEKMMENGSLVSDFLSRTNIDRQNFLRRNRIIAGLADATVIVESAEKGGSLVTADIAGSYNRDVFAFPGRSADNFSRGCNRLIKENKANLIESLDDLEYFMSWQQNVDKPRKIQKQLFVQLNAEEQKIVDALQSGVLYIDNLCQTVSLPMGRVSSLLLGLEFNGLVESLPGKMYRLN
ncbi:DNA-processing protein DprA [Gaoshiqia sp. Z1-71]|uniref:DNA-processing protein DprA n=1 Tax=Gaoshiqia hydrogeniformans TaxID=3290090 RepID=UPI003BF90337